MRLRAQVPRLRISIKLIADIFVPAGCTPLETICEAGEVMFVPRGWWHCVLNVDDTVAVTQNYVSDCNLADVLQFLRIKGEQESS
jgi:hypothetical protein